MLPDLKGLRSFIVQGPSWELLLRKYLNIERIYPGRYYKICLITSQYPVTSFSLVIKPWVTCSPKIQHFSASLAIKVESFWPMRQSQNIMWTFKESMCRDYYNELKNQPYAVCKRYTSNIKTQTSWK